MYSKFNSGGENIGGHMPHTPCYDAATVDNMNAISTHCAWKEVRTHINLLALMPFLCAVIMYKITKEQ